MPNNKELGLFRYTDYIHQDDIKSNLGLALEDLYDSINGARENARELEDVVNHILYGDGCGPRSEYRSTGTKLADFRG